uniref:Uncharacterized protein n=1 Tax=Megaselia scalaris TaxID=36166 RepID=T1GJ04_MEGSC
MEKNLRFFINRWFDRRSFRRPAKHLLARIILRLISALCHFDYRDVTDGGDRFPGVLRGGEHVFYLVYKYCRSKPRKDWTTYPDDLPKEEAFLDISFANHTKL